MHLNKKLYIYIKTLGAVLFLVWLSQTAQAQKQFTLAQSREMALQQNNRIRIISDSIAIAKLGVERAKTNALPSVDASATGLYVGKPLSDYLPERTASVTGTVTQVIYAGGKVRNGVKAAQLNAEVQQLQQVRSRADVILKTDTAYWQVVSAKEQLALLKKSQQYLTNALKDVTNAYEAGLKYKNDVLQVQVQYNQNELQLLRAQNGLKLAKLNLLQVTGMSMKYQFDVLDTVPYTPVALPPDSAFDVNVDKRPEAQLLQRSVDAGELQTRLATANMLPQIAAVAYGFYANSSTPGAVNLLGSFIGNGNVPISVGSNSTSWLAMLSVRVPVFHWGNYHKAVKQQQIRTQAQRYQLQDGRQKLVLDIRQKYNSLTEAEKNVALSNLSVQQASENLRLANDRLKAGTITATDWLQAQTLWQQSKTQAITARVDYNIYTTQFKKAIGELE
ncbi:TolC family protein [Mucilaginibacter sp. Bleaf8]|uniref:TolC family protein n=1 Tax=Mucilaginibacter sp. Bleaf8 TaxID=2834430 RepID=UPI001BD01819|nr:TolC family protein [Mucilaginibacter sp. Bleaf8]MBS7564857.1 TolC family protein [Mucilaginibacter sp. Bleaf8]